jgi:putative nucleotidyltransferase with HDIG domain
MPPPPRMTPREFAVHVVGVLRGAGHEALWAGGCVRDELLGLTPKDYDVATSARPEEVEALFDRTVAVGAAFGVIEVLGRGRLNVQVATFRSDGAYLDGRRPESVVYSTAEEDAQRRDFTINGMFFDPLDGRLIDYVGGQADLQAKLLRAIGDPAERIREDRLRILRGVRMAARFGLEIEPITASSMCRMAPVLRDGVSAERVADELRKILVDPHRSRGLRMFMDMGLAAVVMPELVPMVGLPYGLPRTDGPPLPPPGRPGCAEADLWDHVLYVLDLLGEKPSFPLAMAALLHDVGKPRTVGRTPDRYTFYGHEHVGRRLAGDIGLRLKLANEERDRVEWLVEKHQVLSESRRMRPAKLKTLLVHKGIDELLALHRADAIASGRDCDHVEYAVRMRAEWDASGELAPPPLITGTDLLDMGVPQGPVYKTVLDKVREAQLDGTIRTRDEAVTLVQRVLAEGDEQTDTH